VNGLCNDAVALDTNVFIHLFNPQNNTNNHIDSLLSSLAADELVLLVDDLGYIASEYLEKLTPKIMDASDTGPQASLLRYWMAPERRVAVPVLKKSSLWRSVSFVRGKPLVTNDVMHILNGPSREVGGPRGATRRTRLQRIARDEGLVGLLYSTLEASRQL
jgi:hypothetical protein